MSVHSGLAASMHALVDTHMSIRTAIRVSTHMFPHMICMQVPSLWIRRGRRPDGGAGTGYVVMAYIVKTYVVMAYMARPAFPSKMFTRFGS